MNAPVAELPFRFAAAPWPLRLKAMSLIAASVLCYAAYAVYHRIPAASGIGHTVGLVVTALPLLLLIGSIIFVVRDYTVDAATLYVGRLLTTTRVPLAGLVRVWCDPDVCRNSLRVFGNGGMFAYCGWFYSGRLGFYRVFATDLRNAVVLEFQDRRVVVSPSSPRLFIEHVQRIRPSTTQGGA